MRNREGNVIRDKSFKFAVKVIKLYKYICENKNEYNLSKQLLRSGTSIGANIREATEAQSKKDFIAKLGISLKESAETRYWLELLIETNYIDNTKGNELLSDLSEIIKILNAIIKTSKSAL